MQFVCQYSGSTKKFGPAASTHNYRASVTSIASIVNINYTMDATPPPGREISLDIKLTKGEAMQLAAAIIAQACHPKMHNYPVSWVPATSMLKLERDVWEGKLTANLDTTSDVEFRNDSVFHIGTVQIRVTAKLDRSSDQANVSCVLLKTLDLPPGQSIRISIARAELPFHTGAKYQNSIDILTEATIQEVTGMQFSQT